MSFEQIVRDLERLNVNLYRFAFYTPENGVRVHEFRPCSRCCNSYSVAKAFLVSAIGLLQDDGLLRVEDSIAAYLGDAFPANIDPRWHQATIEHAMTHRLGFDEGFLDIDTEDVSLYHTDDYLQIVLQHPLAHAPGTHYQYSDAAYYLLSRLISRVAGERLDSLLWRRLLKPMGFGEIAWSRCPLEHPLGATGFYARVKDIVKLGAMYMNEGRFEGQQLLSPAWVAQTLQRGYEFHPMGSPRLIGKGGMYGQGVVFAPEKGFAAAWHAYDLNHGGNEVVRVLAQYA